MAAPERSQSSTSLAKLYAGQAQSVPGNETDFCNAFWGPGDKGYEVLMTRLRGAGRTMEELKVFWKERISIEEDYAKRLSKLSKQTLGRDEIGELKICFDTLKEETERQSITHQNMVQEMKTSLDQPSTDFIQRLTNLKRGYQASVEKQYKAKANQEQHVKRARELYEQDCLKINSYTAQMSMIQGKEQDKIQQKLDKSRGSVGQNEQDFKNFVRALESTTNKWELEWKGFCDHVQDLEEERLDFVRDNVWAYANAVSQVCVEDDSSCERIRVGLEGFDSHADMEHFVQGWGTGSQIPDAPRYINYGAGEAYPTHQTFHPARFTRNSARPITEAAPELQEEHVPEQNGVQGSSSRSLRDDLQPQTQQQQRAQSPPVLAPPAPAPVQQMAPPPVPKTEGPPVPANKFNTANTTRTIDDEDPIARALADLRMNPPQSGSIRRGTSSRRPESSYSQTSVRSSRPVAPASPAPAMGQEPQRAGPPRIDTSLLPPASGSTAAALARSRDEFERRTPQHRNGPSQDYGAFADSVVGAHASSTSRPASPSGRPVSVHSQRAPSPALMQPPQNPATPVTDEVLSQYHQAFPGERSRPASRANSISSRRSRGNSFIAPPSQPVQNQGRSPSPGPREGFVGIGAGRSPSPAPVPTQPLGIALDGRGAVVQDTMAEQYRRQFQQQQQQQQQHQQQQHQQQQQQQQPYAPQQVGSSMQQAPRSVQDHQRQSYQAPASPYQQQAPPQQRPTSGYGQYPQQQHPAQQQQQQQQQQQALYQAPVQQAPYAPQQVPHFDPRRQSYQANDSANTSMQVQRPPSATAYHRATSPQPSYNRAPSPSPQAQAHHPRQPSPQPQYQQQPAQAYQQQYYGGNARAPSPSPQQQQPVGRSPSPQPGAVPENAPPTGQWSTAGLPVLFYVKALYDYNASSGAEFDFQAGDIIAVTATPADGWWSGELLDEARRVPGRTDFPSNFVGLF